MFPSLPTGPQASLRDRCVILHLLYSCVCSIHSRHGFFSNDFDFSKWFSILYNFSSVLIIISCSSPCFLCTPFQCLMLAFPWTMCHRAILTIFYYHDCRWHFIFFLQKNYLVVYFVKHITFLPFGSFFFILSHPCSISYMLAVTVFSLCVLNITRPWLRDLGNQWLLHKWLVNLHHS